jgi:hypothetical protein
MHFVYIDDSGDEQVAIFSALAIPDDQWKANYEAIKAFRQEIKKSDGILIRKELHAVNFVTGRGRPAGHRIVTKWRRSQIFRAALDITAKLEGARLFNACVPKANVDLAFERLLNRVNVAMSKSGSRALIISDEGKEHTYTRLSRRLAKFNPIPSRYGRWPSGPTANIPTDRIIEDIVFRDSASSVFLQLVDFCAYALLCSEEPAKSRTKYNNHEAFDLLDPILVKEAFSKDPRGLGIIRK